MQRIFTGLAVWCTLFLAATLVLGVMASGRPPGGAAPAAGPDWFEWHFLAGIFTAFFTLVVHGVVMTYFLGMGGLVKEAVRILGDAGAEFRQRSRRIKMIVFPPATFAPLLVVATAVVGGATGKSIGSAGWHGGLAVATVLYNLHAFRKEYVALGMNKALIDEVEKKFGDKQKGGPVSGF